MAERSRRPKGRVETSRYRGWSPKGGLAPSLTHGDSAVRSAVRMELEWGVAHDEVHGNRCLAGRCRGARRDDGRMREFIERHALSFRPGDDGQWRPELPEFVQLARDTSNDHEEG